MDLEFGEDEAELRDAVRAVLDGISPRSVVRAIYEGTGDAEAVWKEMVALDWPALAIAEEHGGVGSGFVELAIVAEELGRATAPGPWLATATQFAPMVAELGSPDQRARWLPAVAAGSITGTVALAERRQWGVDAVTCTAAAAGGGWVLNGRKEAVIDGTTAEEIVVIARTSDGIGGFVVPRADAVVIEHTVIDPTLRLADVVLADVMVAADRALGTPGAPETRRGLDRAIEVATVAVAISTVGACRRIFDETLEYAKVREQYGKPIGSFQALKHRLAEMYLSVERATSLCYFAALTVAEDDPRRAEAASLAKAAAGDCQRLVANDGLQLHGGIGFTWEHDLHFLLKRAKVGDALFGNAVHHRAVLAARLGLSVPTVRGAA